jgi:hypothetical protein
MEIRTYAALKAAGKARLVRDSDNDFRVLLAKFDADTGERVEQPVPLTKNGLEHAIGLHQQVLVDTPLEIAGIEGVLAEMATLNEAAAQEPT